MCNLVVDIVKENTKDGVVLYRNVRNNMNGGLVILIETENLIDLFRSFLRYGGWIEFFSKNDNKWVLCEIKIK